MPIQLSDQGKFTLANAVLAARSLQEMLNAIHMRGSNRAKRLAIVLNLASDKLPVGVLSQEQLEAINEAFKRFNTAWARYTVEQSISLMSPLAVSHRAWLQSSSPAPAVSSRSSHTAKPFAEAKPSQRTYSAFIKQYNATQGAQIKRMLERKRDQLRREFAAGCKYSAAILRYQFAVLVSLAALILAYIYRCGADAVASSSDAVELEVGGLCVPKISFVPIVLAGLLSACCWDANTWKVFRWEDELGIRLHRIERQLSELEKDEEPFADPETPGAYRY